MCLLFETIKVFERKLVDIDYHNQRLNRTRKLLFGMSEKIDLNEQIFIPDDLDMSLFKCRIAYDEKGFAEAKFSPYKINKINSLKVIRNADIDYSFKYSDRIIINNLLAQKGDCDDILIIKNGYVTDTSICNIVFFDGDKWVTPSTPLLRGTKRERLIQEGVIYDALITEEDLFKFETFALINTFRDIVDNQISVDNIEGF